MRNKVKISHGRYHTDYIVNSILTTIKSDVKAAGDEFVNAFRDIGKFAEIDSLDADSLLCKCQTLWVFVDADDS